MKEKGSNIMENLVRELMYDVKRSEKDVSDGFLAKRQPTLASMLPPFVDRMDAILNNISAKEYLLLQQCCFASSEEDIKAYIGVLTKLLNAGVFKNPQPTRMGSYPCTISLSQDPKTEFVEKVVSGINNSNEEA